MFSAIAVFLVSCDLFKFKSEENQDDEDPVVASVGDQNLRKSELTFVFDGENPSPGDSTERASRYVQTWIKKQLMIREAGKSMSFDEAELNRKLLDYKYALMVYEFEKAHVNANIDQDMDASEIESYYKENQTNFTLKEIIVKTNFFKMKKDNSQNRQLERLLNSNNRDNKESIREIALTQAANYFLEDSTWVRFEDLIINTPLVGHNHKVQLLREYKLIKVEDDSFVYYFKIFEYKLQDQIPPLEFVNDEIYQILINKKKVALTEALQKEIYNRALENNEFKIYD